jgi:hypothetical protein
MHEGLSARKVEKEIDMKTLVSILVAGVLSTASAFAEAPVTSRNVAGDDNTIATPRLAFRLFHKRPAGARQAEVAALKVNVGAPQLPFRPYQKRPTATQSNKPSSIEATNRQ